MRPLVARVDYFQINDDFPGKIYVHKTTSCDHVTILNDLPDMLINDYYSHIIRSLRKYY